MKVIIIYIFGILNHLKAESLNIPDLTKINRVINKDLSANRQDWCASCVDFEVINKKIQNSFVALGGDSIALKQALCFFNKYKNEKFEAKSNPNLSNGIKITNQRYITIEDLVGPSSKPRLFVLDLQTGEVQVTFSSHGGGQKKLGERDVSKDIVKELSNVDNSKLTPRGFFITGHRYPSSDEWKFAMKLYGIQSGINDNTFMRNIVMHPFKGVEEQLYSSENGVKKSEIIQAKQVMPLSWGCTMLPTGHASGIIDKIKAPSTSKGGSLYYNYSETEKKYGENYCGDENLMLKKGEK
jgi:hypothetical protein